MSLASEVARPPAYRGFPYARVGLFIGALILYRQFMLEGLAPASLFNTWLYYSILVIGFYFVFGISGQFAFSQAAVAGLGAYTSAWATRNDQPFILGFIAAICVAAVVGMAFSLLMKRANHFYFAIATLGLSEILVILFKTWDDFSGPAGGDIVNVKPISAFGYAFNSDYREFWVLLGFLALVLVLGYMLERSPLQREAVANRDNEVVSSTSGLPALRIRVTMFTLGAVVAGAAGSLQIHASGGTSVESFGLELGLGIFLMLILGGIGSLWGPILGAWFYVYVQDYLRNVDWEVAGQRINEMWPVVYGSLLVIVMILVPEGLIGVWHRIQATIGYPQKRKAPSWLSILLGLRRRPVPVTTPDDEVVPVAAPDDAARPPIGDVVLSAQDMTVSFGGVRAVDGVSLDVRDGEIVGLIGPNGSGKSTFLNAVTGVVPARGTLDVGPVQRRDRSALALPYVAGAFSLAVILVLLPTTVKVIAVIGAAVLGMWNWFQRNQSPLGRPVRVRQSGVMRTYQTPQTYLHLTCIENVLLSTADRAGTGILGSWPLRPLMLAQERARWERASTALERFGLLERAEESAANLSYGQQRLLELARVVAGEPRVILLDEPSAGLNAAETENLARHLRSLRNEGISILLVDHKIDFLNSLCDRMNVLELGHKVAEGDPDSIWSDQRVVDAYLGVVEEDHEAATNAGALHHQVESHPGGTGVVGVSTEKQ